MKEQLISFETAKLAKKKEFTGTKYLQYVILEDKVELKLVVYERYRQIKQRRSFQGLTEPKRYPAPTQSLLQKWLRDVHDIILTILISGAEHHQYVLHDKNRRYVKTVDNPITPENIDNNWEDTLEKGFPEALKLIP